MSSCLRLGHRSSLDHGLRYELHAVNPFNSLRIKGLRVNRC